MSWWKQEQQDCIEEDLEVNSESSVSIVGSSNEATSVTPLMWHGFTIHMERY